VSTDFDTSDRLYFEPLTKEDIMHIIENEKPEGVICQFGGQTAVNLAEPLAEAGVKILGTSVDSIDLAEDRDRFIGLLNELDIPVPQGEVAASFAEAEKIAAKIGYPVLVRPSYVLGGRAMEVVYNEQELEEEWTPLEREAIIVGQKIKELLDNNYQVFDKNLNKYRSLTYRDIVILLRSP